jgi:hypothetical protein
VPKSLERLCFVDQQPQMKIDSEEVGPMMRWLQLVQMDQELCSHRYIRSQHHNDHEAADDRSQSSGRKNVNGNATGWFQVKYLKKRYGVQRYLPPLTGRQIGSSAHRTGMALPTDPIYRSN